MFSSSTDYGSSLIAVESLGESDPLSRLFCHMEKMSNITNSVVTTNRTHGPNWKDAKTL